MHVSSNNHTMKLHIKDTSPIIVLLCSKFTQCVAVAGDTNLWLLRLLVQASMVPNPQRQDGSKQAVQKKKRHKCMHNIMLVHH